MQQNLNELFDEMSAENTVAWSSVARFVHVQVLQLVRDCLEKAVSGLITCRYFLELSENLEKLVEKVSLLLRSLCQIPFLSVIQSALLDTFPHFDRCVSILGKPSSDDQTINQFIFKIEYMPFLG